MTDSNLPILYQNIMFGLPSEFARDVFLWAVERPAEDRMCYRAEKFARDVDRLIRFIMPAMRMSARMHGRDDADPDLLRFVIERHANTVFGGNVKLSAKFMDLETYA